MISNELPHTDIELDAASMIRAVREAMVASAAAQEAKVQKQRKNRTYPEPNPELWRKQLEDLIDAGVEDITVGYWRVSNEYKESEGPNVQTQSMIAWSQVYAAPRKQVDLWVWDAESGQTVGRPGYQFIQEAARHWQVTRVVCWRFDRFSRGGGEGDVVIRDLKKLGTVVHSSTENISDDFMGELVRLLFLGIARYEACLIGLRTSMGRKIKAARDGTFIGGRNPYGYRGGTVENPGGGKLKIHEGEATLVRMIFKFYGIGYSCKSISDALNKWGIPSRSGTKWGSAQIRNIVLNEPRYRAELAWNKFATGETPIPHLPILETRPKGDRTYIWNPDKKRMYGCKIPDDFNEDPLPFVWRPRSGYFSRAQGMSMATCLYLYDNVTDNFKEIAKRMNELNLPAIMGGRMDYQRAYRMVNRREVYGAVVEEQGVGPIFEPLSPSEHPRHMLMLAFRRAAELRKSTQKHHWGNKDIPLSYENIAAELNKEGYRTISDCKWDATTVRELIYGDRRFKQVRALATAL